MDLTSYFEPFDFKNTTEGTAPLGDYGLGPSISSFSKPTDENILKNTQAVILGVPVHNGVRQKEQACSPDRIRNVLYKLASFETNIRIVDLGNMKPSKSKKGTLLALRDVVEHLRQLNIVVVVLGGSQELTIGICEAFNNDRFFWLSAIDAVFDIRKGKETIDSSGYLTKLFLKARNIFQFSLIGYQQHLTGKQLADKTKDFGSHLRLGELRSDMKQAELLLRNSNVLSFDMGALKYNEAPGTSKKNPNGLYGEEACQLAHYAGLSHRLEVFGLFEMLPEKDDYITPALAAEIIWYFLKGVSNRHKTNMVTAYKVEIEGLDQPIVFRHDRELDRWWFDVQALSGEVIKIACLEEEYKQAAANEIPERWLQFIQKMDNLSK